MERTDVPAMARGYTAEMKVLMICNTDGAMFVFRKPLLEGLIRLGHEVISVTPDGPYRPRIEKLGVRTRVIPIPQYALSPVTNLLLFFRLLGILLSERPDIVHSFTHKPAIFGTIAAFLARVPRRFITITGLGRTFIREDLQTRIVRRVLVLQYRLACRLASTVFFQNPEDLALFTSRRIVKRDAALLTYGSGVDIDGLRPPREAEIATARDLIAQELGRPVTGKRIVLLPARALPEKGILEFYQAARLIQRESSDFVFIHLGIVSEDPKDPLNSRRLQELASESTVHHLGFRDNLADYMAGVDIVALPSAREGMPRTLLEALAMGKCIVTTDVPGCRLAVRDGWNGFLCRFGDPESLARSLLNVDDAMIHECKVRSRAHCESLFSAAALVDLTFGRYFASHG